jgi:hypothetical protein
MSNVGVDLKIKQGMGGGAANKGAAKPRSGAAKGQGNGMGGYNASAVNKGFAEVKGAGGKPSYYSGAGAGMNKK